jgi:PAS domain S-box-containing protein
VADAIEQNDSLPIGAAELLDDLPDAVVIARPDLSLEYINSAGLELLGFDLADLQGMKLLDVVDATELAENPLQLDRIREDRPNLNTRRLVRKDGSTVAVEINAKLLGNGSLRFIGRDATERLNAERRVQEALAEARAATDAIRESEERLRALFERTSVPMSLSDLDDRITAVNPAFAALLGWDASELVGCTYAELTHPDDIERSAEITIAAQRVNSGGHPTSARFEKRYVARDGRIEWCDVTVSPLYEPHGPLAGHVVVAVPVNDAKLAEAALERRAEELAALVQIDRTVLSGDSTAEILDGTLDHLFPLLSCLGIIVSAVYPEEKRTRVLAAVGLPPELVNVGADVPVRGSLDDLVAGRTRTIPDLDAAESNPSYDVGRALGGRSLVFVPLIAAGSLFGVLSIVLAKPGGLAPEELDFVEHAASALGLALRHAQLREELERSAVELAARVEERTADLARALESAEREQALLRSVLDAAPDTIQAVDLEGRVLFSNEPEELVSTLSGANGDGGSNGDSGPVDPGAASLREIEIVGSGRTVSHYAAPIRQGGSIIGRINVLHDVTAERQAEQLKDELLATVSHELRTPVTSIAGFAELLGHPNLSSDKRDRYIAYVRSESERLIGVVNDLLDLQLIERSSLALDLEPVDLRELVGGIVEVQRRSSGRELVFEEGRAAEVACDAARIRQVVENLVVNAVKYSEDAPVQVRVEKHPHAVRVEVQDHGAGIPPAERSRVFERFFRGSEARMRRIRGTGIGLALCREIIEAHGGEINLTSEPGKGSTFWFELPLDDGASP